nr:DUF86 domain-containing protein [Desulfobulbaceae bacterium]
MVDRLLVERILNDLASFVADLQEVSGTPFDQFVKNKQLKRFIERTLHISIEAIIDIAQHIISDERFREPESYKDTFSILHENNIVSDELLVKLQNMAAFRNLLVHYYEKIDDEIIFGILKKNLGDFEAFSNQISVFIQRKS